ncbi:hypothetical protein NDU88_001987 [Pleurodeles waltl]|uniref:Uncharacterized protein n=1 Tax=Pleurodeles waltl TaxID=8319 RepID=A0AAV7WJZ8_PLEWA|nr:hypothetical protein NDU88_001987 [Pleurodeles waltl]
MDRLTTSSGPRMKEIISPKSNWESQRPSLVFFNLRIGRSYSSHRTILNFIRSTRTSSCPGAFLLMLCWIVSTTSYSKNNKP